MKDLLQILFNFGTICLFTEHLQIEVINLFIFYLTVFAIQLLCYNEKRHLLNYRFGHSVQIILALV